MKVTAKILDGDNFKKFVSLIYRPSVANRDGSYILPEIKYKLSYNDYL